MFSGLFEKFLDLIYKKKCLICSCGKSDDFLCKNCLKDVNYLSTFPHKLYDSTPVYSACVYSSAVKKLIQLLKFQHKRKSAGVLAKILSDYFKKLNLKENYVVIYPNSFYFSRLSRGYEHMYLITKEFCKMQNLRFLKDCIKKIKNTTPQYKAKDRFNNIKGAFKINGKYIKTLKNNPVLLIDDIITSGATVEEIINILKEENINNIVVLTVSKAEKL